MRLLVTGASGFLGERSATSCSARDHEVHALVRRAGSEPPGTAAVAGDLTDAGSLARAVESAAPECVVHLAAEIASQRDPARIQEVNVEGTRALIAACEAAGVRRIVFTSTVVTGDAKGALLDEETQLPVETEYGRSKQEGERLRARVLARGRDHPAQPRLRPGGWFVEEFVNRLRQPGRFAVIGSGENWWDVVRVEDVASACADAAERAPAGALYHVVDDEPIRFYDFIALAATALGKGPPRRLPAWLARLAAGADPVRAVTRSAQELQRPHQVRARLGASLPHRPRGRAGRDRASGLIAARPLRARRRVGVSGRFDSSQKEEPMSEENIATSKRGLEEAFNRGNLDVIDEDTTEDFVGHDPIMGDQDRESSKQQIASYRQAFPDIHITIEDIFAAGDKVVIRWSGQGTFENEFMGLQAHP